MPFVSIGKFFIVKDEYGLEYPFKACEFPNEYEVIGLSVNKKLKLIQIQDIIPISNRKLEEILYGSNRFNHIGSEQKNYLHKMLEQK